MNLLQCDLYRNEIKKTSEYELDWEKLKNSSILITGASGLIGSYLIDVIMNKNTTDSLQCKIYAYGRNYERAKERFASYFENSQFEFIAGDINEAILIEADIVDYIIHAASNTHPLAYVGDPVGTIATNIIGTYNLLEFAVRHKTKRFVFLSSVEIYGENRGDVDYFSEDYCGYIDCNTMRAGYPESKRAGETLCQAYIKQKGMDIVIPRLSRIYGPTMLMSDSKALSQFIKKGISNEDIVLKSEGNQFYSYCYVADAVTGILTCLFYGKSGEAYNIADVRSDITLKNLAGLIASYTNKKVIFELPDKNEASGYSKATKAVMSNMKIRELGWNACYSVEDGITVTIEILKDMIKMTF